MNDSKVHRTAVIGLGGMGQRHLAAVAKAGMVVSAVCDLRPEHLEDIRREKAPDANGYVDWDALIEAEAKQIDVLVIATNGPSHAPIMRKAVDAGIKHILCEKPMATNGHDARDMLACCEAGGARLAVNMSRRFAERFIRLRELLLSGAIGEIKHINVSAGAGGLGCIGTHYFDFVSWLGDTNAKWVTATIDEHSVENVRGEQFHDPGGRGLVGYENGMTACFQLSGEVSITPLMQIIGTHGYVDFNSWAPPDRGWIKIYARPKDQWDELKTRFVEPKLLDYDPGPQMDLVDAASVCLHDLVGDHAIETAAAGVESVDTVMAFHLSSQRDGQRVYLPLVGGDLEFDVPIT